MNDFTLVIEALENMKKWKPIYETLLMTCRNKKEALEALSYLIRIAEETQNDS